MKFHRVIGGGKVNKWVNVGGSLGIVRCVNEPQKSIIVVAYPNRGAGDDQESALF